MKNWHYFFKNIDNLPEDTNAYGSVTWMNRYEKEILVICEHGGSMWLCKSCAVKIKIAQETKTIEKLKLSNKEIEAVVLSIKNEDENCMSIALQTILVLLMEIRDLKKAQKVYKVPTDNPEDIIVGMSAESTDGFPPSIGQIRQLNGGGF